MSPFVPNVNIPFLWDGPRADWNGQLGQALWDAHGDAERHWKAVNNPAQNAGCHASVLLSGIAREPSMNPFRNLQINLLAKGGWALMSILAICIALVGILGQGELAGRSLTALITIASFLAGAMALWPRN